MSRPLPDKLKSAALTDVGLTRSENQDACGLFVTKSNALLAVVADGMGGHAGGSTASRLAVETIHEHFAVGNEQIDAESLAATIVKANERIYDKAMEEPELRGMGTTVVVLLFHPDGRAWVAHVGDSRAYRLRGGTFEALTEDHSVVAQLVSRGDLSEAEAELDPRRNEILRSVGVGPSVEPEISPVSVHPGDRFLLCSDGLTGPVEVREIASILGLYDPEDAARTLVARANGAGSPDNVTAIAVHYPDPHEVTQPHAVAYNQDARGSAETTASEFDLIMAERTEQRLERARQLLVLATLVGVALLMSVIALVVMGTGTDSPPPSVGTEAIEGTARSDSATSPARKNDPRTP